MIQLSGYTEDEKLGIARKLPDPEAAPRARAHDARSSRSHDTALRLVIREYTREAGRPQPRAADRCAASQGRDAGREGRGRRSSRVDEAALREWLGPRRFSRRGAQAHLRARAWRPGSRGRPPAETILFIEATAYAGKGRLKLTGQLGEVMQESAQAALSWVRSHAVALGSTPTGSPTHDVHIHVPAGAVPKDGPSAGVTMATAIVSLVTRPSRSRTTSA